MELIPKKPFLKDLEKLYQNRSLCQQIDQLLTQLELSETLPVLPTLKKLHGHSTAYRIRLGDYRIGLFVEENVVILVRCLHRREIYRHFP
jgi:mRNA interferase RelE/StbE